MRKIVITGVAATLALGLTACGSNGDGISAATPPASSASPTSATSSPNGTSTPNTPSTPGASSTPRHASAPQGSDGSGPGHAQAGGQQIKEKWGPLHYVAPGKYTVGNVVFFTATDTVLYTAGTACPNGDIPPGESKCTIENFDDWAQAAQHNVSVRFSGQAATVITETQ